MIRIIFWQNRNIGNNNNSGGSGNTNVNITSENPIETNKISTNTFNIKLKYDPNNLFVNTNNQLDIVIDDTRATEDNIYSAKKVEKTALIKAIIFG